MNKHKNYLPKRRAMCLAQVRQSNHCSAFGFLLSVIPHTDRNGVVK